MTSPNFVSFTDYGQEQERIARNRRLAEQLRQESAVPVQAGSVAPGGYFVATNPLTHLAQALKGVNANMLRTEADTQSRTLADKRSQALADALKGMPTPRTVTERTDHEGTGSFDMSGMSGPATATVKPTMADSADWMGQLAKIGPDAVQYGTNMLSMQQKADEADESRKWRSDEAAATRVHQLESRKLQLDHMAQQANLSREQAFAIAKAQQENTRAIADAHIQSRLDMARFAAGNRPQPQQQIIETPSGPMVLGPGGMATPVTGPDGRPVPPKAVPKDATKEAELKRTVDAYVAARDGLMTGLSGSVTGAVAGRLPAMTTGQQVAEGGVAAMAPVLKQIFRVAGEGTFTDKDQELLLNMVPTRKDTPAARKDKSENIDRIVAAKLGVPIAPFGPTAPATGVQRAQQRGGGSTAPRIGDIQDGYRFKGGNPADPNAWERQ